MRKNIVAGNWKMNTIPAEGAQLAKAIVEKFQLENVELILAPPYTHLDAVGQVLNQSKVKLASQNIAKEDFGAYTGEIAGEMLQALNVEYTLIGHSERRAYYGEKNETLFIKTKKAISLGIHPIFCVGENLEEREGETHFAVIKTQLEEGLFKLDVNDFSEVIIAYEPVWAIGTGKTASPEQAQEIHAFIRKMVSEMYNSEVSESLSILYGGSCNAKNAKAIFAQNDIDGGLIGGAALKSEDFIKIAESF